MTVKNAGKAFEKDFEKSCPDNVFIRRIRDVIYVKGSGSSEDYIVYKKPNLYLFELKSHLGKSLPLTIVRYKKGKRMGDIQNFGVIGKDQLDKLNSYRDLNGVNAGFIINFRDEWATYYVPVGKVYDYIYDEDRKVKSIPIEWCEENGLRIPQKKKITRFTYDFRFLDSI